MKKKLYTSPDSIVITIPHMVLLNSSREDNEPVPTIFDDPDDPSVFYTPDANTYDAL